MFFTDVRKRYLFNVNGDEFCRRASVEYNLLCFQLRKNIMKIFSFEYF